MKQWLEVGYVSRAHGLKGELVIKTFDPSSTVLSEVDTVHLVPRVGPPIDAVFKTLRDSPGSDLLAQFEGVSTRAAAEALVGAKVSVNRDQLDEPDDGEFFQGDLVGLHAVTEDGRSLGIVAEVWSSGPVPNLVLKNGDAEDMVPFAEDFVVKVDLAANTIVLRPLVFT